jgi:hypothetical protein
MATKSFYENLVIETEEECQILLRAFEEAESGKRPKLELPDTERMLEEGERWLDEGGFDAIINAVRSSPSGCCAPKGKKKKC